MAQPRFDTRTKKQGDTKPYDFPTFYINSRNHFTEDSGMSEFNAVSNSIDLIGKIAERGHGLFEEFFNLKVDRMDIVMDLVTCDTVCPLDLKAMLDGKDSDLIHDLAGINKSMNRETLELEDCFVPRFALKHHWDC